MEVENALANTAVASIGIPDERRGEAVHDLIVRKAGSATTPHKPVGHCLALIAYHKAPRSIIFDGRLADVRRGQGA